jgi:hypothetical protein
MAMTDYEVRQGSNKVCCSSSKLTELLTSCLKTPESSTLGLEYYFIVRHHQTVMQIVT